MYTAKGSRLVPPRRPAHRTVCARHVARHERREIGRVAARGPVNLYVSPAPFFFLFLFTRHSSALGSRNSSECLDGGSADVTRARQRAMCAQH